MDYEVISRGLLTLIRDGRRHPDIMLRKLNEMQNAFLQKNPSLYSAAEEQSINYYMKALSYKFHLSNLSLEQLWSLSEQTRMKVVDALQNSLDNLDVSDDELLLIAFTFEGFLFYAKSFLDFYMLYICFLFCTGYQGSMSTKRFYKELRKDLREPFKSKAEQIEKYFQTKVFGNPGPSSLSTGNWGTLLTSMRDKVAHRDLLRPSFESEEKLAKEILFNWPTIQQETYDRFCQMMQNGMFFLIQDTTPILYDLEWKSGPYRPGIWE